VVEIGFGVGPEHPVLSGPRRPGLGGRAGRRRLEARAQAAGRDEHPGAAVRPRRAQKGLVGGCHLTRPVADLLTGVGFEITELDVYCEEGSPRFLGANPLGVARSP